MFASLLLHLDTTVETVPRPSEFPQYPRSWPFSAFNFFFFCFCFCFISRLSVCLSVCLFVCERFSCFTVAQLPAATLQFLFSCGHLDIGRYGRYQLSMAFLFACLLDCVSSALLCGLALFDAFARLPALLTNDLS